MARPASVATSNREDEYLGNPYTSFYTRTLLAGKVGWDGSWKGRKQVPSFLPISDPPQLQVALGSVFRNSPIISPPLCLAIITII